VNIKNAIKRPSTLLSLAALCLVASAPPTEAIDLYKYDFEVGGSLSGGGTISGYFVYDLDGSGTSAYKEWDITTTNGKFNGFRYTQSNSIVLAQTDASLNLKPGAGLTSILLQGFALRVLSLPSGENARELYLSFGTRSGDFNNTENYTPLTNANNTIMQSNDFFKRPSVEAISRPGIGADDRGLTANIQATATPIPFETDVLPFAGATALFAGGVWWKRRRGQGVAVDSSVEDSEVMARAEIK
jgi:hypothetical protein